MSSSCYSDKYLQPPASKKNQKGKKKEKPIVNLGFAGDGSDKSISSDEGEKLSSVLE